MTVPNLTQEDEANSLRRSREPYVKELGKLTPEVSDKGCLREEATGKRKLRLFTKNTGLCEVDKTQYRD